MKANLPDLNCASENREQSRTHLFVIAALNSEVGSTPVHVRNMSQSGALVEANDLPAPGTRITLKRGSLAAGGRIAWKGGRRAGISFDSSIFVADWMSRLPADHQSQVDEMVDSIKQGLPQPDSAASHEARGLLDILAELAVLKADLTQLGNSLAGDMIMVATHPELQLLDISIQRTDRIVARLHSCRWPRAI